VFPLEAFETRQPIFDLLQLRRRGVHAVGIGAEERRQVLELRLHGPSCFEILRERRVEGRQLFDLLPDAAKLRQRRALVVVQFGVSAAAQAVHALGVGQHATGRLELRVLARHRLDSVDLGQLEPHELEPRRPLACIHRRARQSIAQLPDARPPVRHAGGGRLEPRIGVEEAEVRRRIEQELVFVLAVELDEVRGHVAQHAGGGQGAVDERAAAARGGDLAPDEHLGPIGALEERLDGGRIGPGPHQVGRSAASQEQTDSLHQDRLPRAGLTGESGEPGVELDLDGFDHRQVADAKRAQHVGGNPIVSYV
jgi:hypothetical protein